MMKIRAAMIATSVVGTIIGIFAAIVAAVGLLAYVAGVYAIPILAVGSATFILGYIWWKVYTDEQ